MKVYLVGDSFYTTSKREAVKRSNAEYHKRFDLYGCDQWYKEPISSHSFELTKNGVIDFLNQSDPNWILVEEGGWRGNA